MATFWDEELTEEQVEALIEHAAQEVTKRRLEAPAIFILESHKPLANVGAHAVLAFSPFIVPFFGFDKVNQYTALLRNRENVERLITRIEQTRISGKESGSKWKKTKSIT